MPKSNSVLANANIKDFVPRKHLDLNKCVYVFYGQSGSGKTTCMLNILAECKNCFDYVVVFSKTNGGTNIFNGCWCEAPPAFLFSVYNHEAFVSQFEAHKKRITQLAAINNELRKSGMPPFRLPRLLFVFDDCSSDPKFVRSAELKEIAENGRNWRIVLMVATQYINDIPPPVRSNAHFVFSCIEGNEDNQLKMYRYFFGSAFPNFPTFQSSLTLTTKQKGRALVINRATPPDMDEVNGRVVVDISKCVFKYEFKRFEDYKHTFKLGGKSQWQFSEKRIIKQPSLLESLKCAS